MSETELAPSFDPSDGPPSADASPEPEAEVVEAEVEAAEAEEQESEAESPPADEQNVEKKSDPFQERIDKLTRRFRETERDLDQVAKERDEALRRLQELDVPRTESKTLADFDHDEDAYREYLFAEAEKRAEGAAKRVVQGYESNRESDKVLDQYHSRERTFASTVEDFDSVVYDEALKISPVMAAEIRASELGPELAYHLGKNPDIASRISELSERAAVREMVRLETKLQTAKDTKGKEVSDAPPPPPKKVKSGDPGTEKDPAKMTDTEFRKWREKQIAARR
jgi:hypothetical protein